MAEVTITPGTSAIQIQPTGAALTVVQGSGVTIQPAAGGVTVLPGFTEVNLTPVASPITIATVTSSTSVTNNVFKVEEFATEAALLAATRDDSSVAYAQDTDKFYFRQAGAWLHLDFDGLTLRYATEVALLADTPTSGRIAYAIDTENLFFRAASSWEQLNGGSGTGVELYATEVALLAATSADGTIAYAQDTNRYYFRQDGAWELRTKIGTPTSGNYAAGFETTFTEATELADAIQTLNENDLTIVSIVAPPPGGLTSQTLTLGGSTAYSAKLPSGLPGAWGSYTPGDTITGYLVDGTFTLSTPSPATRFSVGLDTAPGGNVEHILDGSAVPGSTRAATAGVGVTGDIEITSDAVYNTVWRKQNARINYTQADGRATHAINHTTSSGQTNTSIYHYDSLATAPTFSVAAAVAVNSETLKRLSGIDYYTSGTDLQVSATAASAFEQAYHPTEVGRIECPGTSNLSVNPASPPAVGATFAISESRVLSVSAVDNSPTATVRFFKPDGQTVSQSPALARKLSPPGTQSTATADPFTDETQRLVADGAFSTSFDGTVALTNGNLQVFNGSLVHGNDGDAAGFTGDQLLDRLIDPASPQSGGTLTHTGVTISAFGTGTVNILLFLETDALWFDLRTNTGSANGSGDGSTPANSIGAYISGGAGSTVWSLAAPGFGGPYSTGSNGNRYGIRIIYRSTGATMTLLSGA